MAIVKWNPWDVDRLFDDDWDTPNFSLLTRNSLQGLNLYETEGEIVAEVALPGIPDDRIDITVDDGIVRVSATSEDKKEDKDKRHYYMSQMSTSYNYAFRLPQSAISDSEPVCELGDGVLTMKFPKVQKAVPKKLKVNKVATKSK